jgi:hypothetical protein
MPPLPAEMLGTLLKDQWVESPDPADHLRRGIYVFVRRNLRYPLFDVLDSPDRSATCPRRNVTTTATQALWLLNSDLSLARASSPACCCATHPHPPNRGSTWPSAAPLAARLRPTSCPRRSHS